MHSTEKKSLASLTMIVTRPKHQAASLCQRLEMLGAKIILLPSIEITGTTPNPALKEIQSNDIAIFLSANAVKYTESLWSSVTTQPMLIAIGPGTKAELSKHTQALVILPEHYSSEGLLNLTPLNAVAKKTIYLCSGENSRPLLAKTLQKRGATVVPIISYRRNRVKPNPQTLQQLKNPCKACSITTSEESLIYFHRTITQANLLWLLAQPLLITSQRATQTAQKLGFTHIIYAKDPTDHEIITTLKREYP